MVEMDQQVAPHRCRACDARLRDQLIDLGLQPDPDGLLDQGKDVAAPVARIDLWLCGACGLVQLVGPRPSGPVPRHGHAAGDSVGAAPWPVDLARSSLRRDRLVVDVDVADRATGRALATAGFSVHGFSRQSDLPHGADPWIANERFDAGSAEAIEAAGQRAGLVVASHALSHADDPDALVAAIRRVLAPDGIVAIEFHHVLGLIEGQFDVLSHAHRSYFSLLALERLLERHNLVLHDAEVVATFGGTIRAAAMSLDAGRARPSPALDALRRAEDLARSGERDGYAAIPGQVSAASAALIGFLERARDDCRLVAGYGAPARGTVLLNFAGVDASLLPFTVDRDPAKQGKLLPGCRIGVHPPSEIDARRPDDILVLPWPLADEIVAQWAGARAQGARFAVAMPRLRFLP